MKKKIIIFSSLGIIFITLVVIVVIMVISRLHVGDELGVIKAKQDESLSLTSSTVLSDGSFVAVGKREEINQTNNVSDGIVYKFDQDGSPIWSRIYTGSYYTDFNHIITLRDGNILVSGYEGSSSGYTEACIFKLDQDGNLIWERRLTDYNLNYSMEARDGGILLVGYKGENEAVIVKLNDKGYVIWEKEVLGESFNLVVETDDHTILAIGTSTFDSIDTEEETVMNVMAPPRETNLIIVEFDLDGNIIQNKVHEMTQCYFNSITKTDDGNFLIAGANSGYVFLTSFSNPLLIKIDQDGEILWIKGDGSDKYHESIQDIILTNDGYIAVGRKERDFSILTLFSNNYTEPWIVKYDFSGNIVWEHNINRKEDEEYLTVVETNDHFFTLGYSCENSKKNDKDVSKSIIIGEYNQEGNILDVNK